MAEIKIDHFMTARGILGNRLLTDELLSEIIATLALIDPSVNSDTLNTVRKKLESSIGISMTTGTGIREDNRAPWLEDRKANITWHYWESYERQLQDIGFNRDVIRVLGEDADNILTECGNPELLNQWNVRGLVMGDVQSGKTASYGGLVSKAADAGYKVIVLLTGMIEELRSQTQGRLDEGFVGKDSRDILGATQNAQRIGAGRFRAKTPNVLTSVDSDFLTANARALGGIPLENINEPVLFVMKKNKSALENVIGFLDSQIQRGSTTLNLPLLIVDDEADNASVNAKKDDDPATINRLIRALISRFNRSSYVAYTATPFANVFINPDIDDLFPADFIYSLNPPSNYIGATDIFSEGGKYLNQVRDIDDAEPVFPFKHKKDLVIGDLPQTLKEAVHTFLLSCAIRDYRKEMLRHRSMLVNVSRLTNVQGQVATRLKQYLHAVTEEIKQYMADGDLWRRHPLLIQLYESWVREYSDIDISWDEIRALLYDSIASVKIITINQGTNSIDRLNYSAYKNTDKGRRAIAVGGLSLSRGLTLEGLCVSYFYRDSKAYDTLLQMGRWFGYRPGYEDLFRIWMDAAVQDWFCHISDVVDELKKDLRRMHANRLPPARFGIRVRSKPDTLIVTALNKMRNAEEVVHAVSFSGYGAETPFLPKSNASNLKNLSTVREFLSDMEAPRPIGRAGTKYLWSGVKSRVVANFLNNLEINDTNIEFIADISGKGRPLVSFIASNEVASLQEWDICVPTGEGSAAPALGLVLADGSTREVKCRQRQFEIVNGSPDYLKLNKQRVGDVSDEMVGLDEAELKSAAVAWEEERKRDIKKGEGIPGYMYRTFRKRPLLTIHLIEPTSPKPDAKKKASRMMKPTDIESSVLVAISLSFPEFEGEDEKTLVPYRLNKVALRNLGYLRDDKDDDED